MLPDVRRFLYGSWRFDWLEDPRNIFQFNLPFNFPQFSNVFRLQFLFCQHQKQRNGLSGWCYWGSWEKVIVSWLTLSVPTLIIIINLYLFLIKVKVIVIIPPAADPQPLIPGSPAILQPGEIWDSSLQSSPLTCSPLRSVLNESLLVLKVVTWPRWSQNCLSEHVCDGGQSLWMTRPETGRTSGSSARISMMSSEELTTFADL